LGNHNLPILKKKSLLSSNLPFSSILGRVYPTRLGVGDSAIKFGIKLKPIPKRNGLFVFAPDASRFTAHGYIRTSEQFKDEEN